MKILTLATEYPPAPGYGLSRYIYEFSKALSKKCSKLHIVTRNYSNGKDVENKDGVSVHYTDEVLPFDHYDWISNTVLANVKLLEQAVAVIKKHGPFDIVTIHDWLGALAGKSIKQVFDIPLVLFMHDTEIGKSGEKLSAQQAYVAEIEKWVCDHAHTIIACSDFLKKEISKHYHVSEDKIRVIHCGFNPDTFKIGKTNLPRYREIFANKDQILAGFIGRFSHVKGTHLIVESARELISRHPSLKFAFIGDGYLKDKLLARINELGLSDHFYFTGHLNGKVLASFYKILDFLITPSIYEPFGMVALEAAANGIPVIYSDTCGLGELAKIGSFGKPIKPNSIESLIDVTDAVANNLLTEKKLSSELVVNLKSLFDWNMSAQKLVDILRQRAVTC